MKGIEAYEVNFDGLVGLTHNYAGLSFGNVASSAHGGLVSSPRAAALQGLEKMMALHRLGMRQAVLPPHERPHIKTLKKLGFSGSDDATVINSAASNAPHILASACSASAMWVANAATISPFADTTDGLTHITPANLNSMFHRSIEVETTARILKSIFSTADFVHHEALPAGSTYADEGAANHTRFCSFYGEEGVELFVFGSSKQNSSLAPKKYPARQTLESCEAISRKHHLNSDKVVFAQQNPRAIDAGVFHNDVIAVGNRNLLFCHELAFVNNLETVEAINAAFNWDTVTLIEVPEKQVKLEDAVTSYLFNSQLISVPGSVGTTIIVPTECRENTAVYNYLSQLEAEHDAIHEVKYFDLRQSMNNGGGPACLRLRVVLTQDQIDSCEANVFLSDELYDELKAWIETHYREKLAPQDLADPAILVECRTALDRLTQILNLGSVYDFQLN